MSSAKNILIITQEIDPHADYVLKLLRQMGHSAVRLHPANIPTAGVLTYELSNAALDGQFHFDGRVIRPEEMDAVWWRKPRPYRLPRALSFEEREFAKLEINTVMKGIWSSLDCYWMSQPAAIREASYKLEQLKRAVNLGFGIPQTLITSDPERVRSFYETCEGQIVYKVMSDPMLGISARLDHYTKWIEGDVQDPLAHTELPQISATYTTPITEDYLNMLDTVQVAPCMFQAYVDKQYELRVIVVGDEVFPAEIHSQAHADTRVDWRHYEIPIPYKHATLPEEISTRCVELTKSYGLNYGAIDLIVTPEGEYVFLEINPNGQWMWVQELVPTLKIGEAIAYYLAHGTRKSVFTNPVDEGFLHPVHDSHIVYS
ncbi:MAG: MvdC/MvdD family ATP grasp protein [Chloroflexota bacterium]